MIFSPHCDDVPLSLGGALIKGSFGTKVSVYVVFSISRYTKKFIGMETKITRLRIAEEKRAGIQANYRPIFLGYPEPFVRPGYSSLKDLFNPCVVFRKDPVWKKVRQHLGKLIINHKGLICVPISCGNHIDHRIVSACVWEILEKCPKLPVLFYEDLPYAFSYSYREISELLRINNTAKIPIKSYFLTGTSIRKKLHLLRTYKSQLDSSDFEAVKYCWALSKGERVWLTAMARKTFDEK